MNELSPSRSRHHRCWFASSSVPLPWWAVVALAAGGWALLRAANNYDESRFGLQRGGGGHFKPLVAEADLGGAGGDSVVHPVPLCSCWNSTADAHCCSRAFLRAHKFGVLLEKKYSNALGLNNDLLPRPLFRPNLVPKDGGQDYRHVALVRDATAAFVSGYLYHRSGHECWISPEGQPFKPGHEWHVPWYEMLHNKSRDWPASPTPPWLDLSRFPPGQNRSLCQYLLDEDEETGMVAYATFVMVIKYIGILPYLRRAEERDRNDGVPYRRTLLVCLEEASDPRTQGQVLQRIADFLYPGGLPPGLHSHAALPRGDSGNRSGGDGAPATPGLAAVVDGPGGHATERDDAKRNRLRDLVRRMDRDIFDGAIQAMSSQWNCSETYR